ncbi:hypothetical protein CANCADRAFT_146825 [Tortispora caseinolytica NRRL Y-17796]|uniref:Uncharacterized protein n=1 Tax=Tortispora caseinolytica NRRL Y-17796 TaxID=767744 RepID=A0A1E4T9P9_9ASCO|nr:hypothetical protein CANCADRAFT_146825 [Tortispora caseinolytica NRRL Y-17796]
MSSILRSRPIVEPALSFTETYKLANKARSKLTKSLEQADHDLRAVVTHANFLDDLVAKVNDRDYYLKTITTPSQSSKKSTPSPLTKEYNEAYVGNASTVRFAEPADSRKNYRDMPTIDSVYYEQDEDMLQSDVYPIEVTVEALEPIDSDSSSVSDDTLDESDISAGSDDSDNVFETLSDDLTDDNSSIDEYDSETSSLSESESESEPESESESESESISYKAPKKEEEYNQNNAFFKIFSKAFSSTNLCCKSAHYKQDVQPTVNMGLAA